MSSSTKNALYANSMQSVSGENETTLIGSLALRSVTEWVRSHRGIRDYNLEEIEERNIAVCGNCARTKPGE